MATNNSNFTYLATKIVSKDAGGDGFFEGLQTDTYNPEGQLITRIDRYTQPGLAFPDREDTTYYVYDASGKPVSETVKNSIGEIKDTTEYIYNSNGKIISKIKYSYNGNIATKYIYDEFGNLISEVKESSKANGIVFIRESTTNAYDSLGRLASNTYVYDGNGDISTEQSHVRETAYTYTYNDQGYIATKSHQYISYLRATSSYYYDYIYTYDLFGKIVSEAKEGYSEFISIKYPIKTTIQYTYDEKDNLISKASIIESDYSSLTGQSGPSISYESESFIYDDNGNLISSILDGLSTLKAYLYKYDTRGNLVSKIYEYDNKKDDITDERISELFAYDSSGNLIEESYSHERYYRSGPFSYSPGELTLDESTITRYIYAPLPLVTVVPEPSPPTPQKPPLLDSVIIDLSGQVDFEVAKFTLHEASLDRGFLGFYAIDDHSGGIDLDRDGVTELFPGNSGYIEAVLATYEPSLILQSDWGGGTQFVHEMAAGKIYAPFFILNGLPNYTRSFDLASVYLPFAAAHPDGRAHIQFSEGAFRLEIGFDADENNWADWVMGAEFLTGERPTLLNLSDITGQMTLTFTLNREAAFDNFVGFYAVMDNQGGIDINGDSLADLWPGDNGYTEAALAHYEPQVALVVEDLQTTVFTSQFAGGKLYAPFLIAHGHASDLGSINLAEVYFAFRAANADGAEHIKAINGNLYFEDWFGGGDNDFNDAIVQVVM